MTIEIHQPELERRMQAEIQSGHFRDIDDLLTTALDALQEKQKDSAAIQRPPRPENSLVEVCAAVRGLADDLELSRSASTARPVEL
jgi:Arc/MetJ-type ribon-helix-helix transcriptional regulator